VLRLDVSDRGFQTKRTRTDPSHLVYHIQRPSFSFAGPPRSLAPRAGTPGQGPHGRERGTTLKLEARSTPPHQQPSSDSRDGEEDGAGGDAAPGRTKLIASLGVAGGLAALIIGGVVLKDQIKSFLDLFIGLVDEWGPLGYIAYAAVYAGLELLAVPAIPLTMTAGIIFGVGPGLAVVSIAATIAATAAFLIARYLARDKVAAWANKNPKFAAIDRAIGKDGFRVVALLRLSPLLPLAASNYLYGLTSVDVWSYIAASWLGMLPGTLAYVAAGTYGRDFFLGGAEGMAGSGAGGVEPWQVAVGLSVTLLAVGYVGRLAKKALTEVELESEEERDSEGSTVEKSTVDR
jgi:uncharacterized membrane protein YdjX (TVP38/TMEM64 family)